MLKKYLTVFFVSMVPLIELRGAIPYGVIFGLPLWSTYIIAIIGATPYPTRWMNRLSEGPKTGRVLAVAAPVALMALLAVVTAYLVDGSFNPFLYFRF